MWRRFRPPLLGVAVLLAGLMALLATLQYRWLGQVSEAERERMQSTTRTGASEFALDVDRELTRAYLLFQIEPGSDAELPPRLIQPDAKVDLCPILNGTRLGRRCRHGIGSYRVGPHRIGRCWSVSVSHEAFS